MTTPWATSTPAMRRTAQDAPSLTWPPASRPPAGRPGLLVLVLGEVSDDIPLLVIATPLNEVLGAEHRVDRPSQGLRTIDHKQPRLRGPQAPSHQLLKQGLGDFGVLGGS
jgi:hypothetical protein